MSIYVCLPSNSENGSEARQSLNKTGTRALSLFFWDKNFLRLETSPQVTNLAISETLERDNLGSLS